MGGLLSGDKFKNMYDPLRLFSKDSEPPAPPQVQAPPAMPVPDDKAARDAERRRQAAVRRRTGRQSTFLTNGNDDPLG